MYCSTCGRAVTRGLSYCNHCGARLNQGESDQKSSELQPGLLVSAICFLFILGLVALTALMGVMKVILQLPVDRVLGFTLPVFLLMVLIEALLIRLLLLRTKGMRATSDSLLAKSKATNELDAAQARALPENIPSVTENTTRAFDPIYTERK